MDRFHLSHPSLRTSSEDGGKHLYVKCRMYHHITQNNFLSEEELCDIPKKTPQFTNKPLEITDKPHNVSRTGKTSIFN